MRERRHDRDSIVDVALRILDEYGLPDLTMRRLASELGVPLQALVTGLSLGEAALSSLVFLPGDVLKAAIATVLTMLLFRAYPAAFPARVRAQRAALR